MTLRGMIDGLSLRARVALVAVVASAVLLAAAQIAAPWWPGWPANGGGSANTVGGYAAWTHGAWALGRLVVVVAAVWMWAWRGYGRSAAVLVAWGLVELSAGLGAGHSGVLMVWGFVADGALTAALFAHLVLTYPDGRPRQRWQRLFLTCAYGAAAISVAYVLVAEPSWIVSCAPAACPPNPLLVHASYGLAWTIWWAQRGIAVGLVVWLAFLLLHRLRTDPAEVRQPLVGVLGAAAVPAVVFVWRLALDAAYPRDDPMWTALRCAEILGDLAVPAAVLLGMLWWERVSVRPVLGTTVSIPAQARSVEEAQMTAPDPRPLSAIPVAPAVGEYLDDEASERTPDPREVRHTVPPVDENGNVIEEADDERVPDPAEG